MMVGCEKLPTFWTTLIKPRTGNPKEVGARRRFLSVINIQIRKDGIQVDGAGSTEMDDHEGAVGCEREGGFLYKNPGAAGRLWSHQDP